MLIKFNAHEFNQFILRSRRDVIVEDVNADDDGEYDDFRDLEDEEQFYDSLNERKDLKQTIRRPTGGKATAGNEMTDFTLDSDSALWGFEHED